MSDCLQRHSGVIQEVLRAFGIDLDPPLNILELAAHGSLQATSIPPSLVNQRYVVKAHANDVAKLRYHLCHIAWLRETCSSLRDVLPVYVISTQGAPFAAIETSHAPCLWTVSMYIARGSVIRREVATVEQCEALGRLAAQLTNAFDANPRPDHFPVHHYKSRLDLLREFPELPSGVPDTHRNMYVRNLNYCVARLARCYPFCKRVPLIHNDLGFQNVLVSESNPSTVIGLLDFDMAQSDIRVAEFNNLVFSTPGHQLLSCCLRDGIVEAIRRGYEQHLLVPLSEAEAIVLVEVLRSRLLEEVLRHIYEKYPQGIVQNTCTPERHLEERWGLLATFEAKYPAGEG